MKTYIIQFVSITENEKIHNTYTIVSDCIGNALQSAKNIHPLKVIEYQYHELENTNWKD